MIPAFDVEKINDQMKSMEKLPQVKPLPDELVWRTSQGGAEIYFVVRNGETLFFDRKYATPVAYNPFSIDNIIAYMEHTDAAKWATDVVRTKDGDNCFFGHLFNFAGGTLWNLFEEMYATEYMIYPVNDGENATYPQATAKERVIAYLKDLRDGKAKTTHQLMEEECRAMVKQGTENHAPQGPFLNQEQITSTF